MLKKYLLKTFFLSTLIFFFNLSIGQNGDECFRIIGVDTELDFVTISNLTASTQDLSDYRLCSLFSYTNTGIETNTTVVFGDISNIPSGNFVIVGWPLNDIAADLGLYLPTGNFDDPSAMVDFMQYGSAGNGREDEAVAAGLWTVGDFVPTTGLMAWIGNCNDHTSASWFFNVGIEGIRPAEVRLEQNPIADQLSLSISEPITEDLRIQIVDLSGKIILSEELIGVNKSRITFDTSDWNSGVYLSVIQIGDSPQQVIKVIKD